MTRDRQTMGLEQFLRLVREDWATHGRRYGAPGFHTLLVHRLGVWAAGQSTGRRGALLLLYRLAYAFIRAVYGVELPRQTKVGRRLLLPHPVGVVVSGEAEIGDDCWVRQCVTIGRFDRGRERPPPYAPRLGKGVEVGAGAILVGGITVGDGARIGPNAVVMTDVPEGGSAFAQPARIMRPFDSTDDQRRPADHDSAADGTVAAQVPRHRSPEPPDASGDRTDG